MDVRFKHTVEEFAQQCREWGLDHVEIKREYLHGHPDTPSPVELAALREELDVSLTLHAPFRDWNLGSFNEAVREASVEMVCQTLTDAAIAGAGAVVVHGGSVPRRYPEWVRETARENARRSLRACVEHAAEVGVPLCLENQPHSDSDERHTTTPDDLAAILDTVDAEPRILKVTLDVGHAKMNGFDYREFLERFGDRIEVVHLHDNDGTSDQHEPHTDLYSVVEDIGARFNVLEMKTVADVRRSVQASAAEGHAWPT
ncbi:sugar phosphate isomerase/epimerase family protein [Halobellus sp. EA9]|uniref:sugar phosphate isomerase/epimerase family protein n=1 Tax=Halobellus sp. EA9 TaxID=3421647 RepID=UPI003EBA4BD4